MPIRVSIYRGLEGTPLDPTAVIPRDAAVEIAAAAALLKKPAYAGGLAPLRTKAATVSLPRTAKSGPVATTLPWVVSSRTYAPGATRSYRSRP